MLLSIIVPVYNVSKYLEKCLDSLLSQDLTSVEYEIIIVNDGSTDNSLEIAQKYADLNSNVYVLTQANGGLSAARNTGIKQAVGKYIQFVDSDDYLEPNILRKLIDKAERDNLDVLRFNYQNVNEQYHVFEPYKTIKPFVDYRDEVCDGLKFLTERLGYGCYAWQFMIRATLLQAEAHHFKAGIYFEDTEWTPRLLVRAQRVTSVDTMVYNYLIRINSITQTINLETKHKHILDRIEIIKTLEHILQKYPNNKSLRVWVKGMNALLSISILNDISFFFYHKRRTYFKLVYQNIKFPLSYSKLTYKQKRKVFICNISPQLYLFLKHKRY